MLRLRVLDEATRLAISAGRQRGGGTSSGQLGTRGGKSQINKRHILTGAFYSTAPHLALTLALAVALWVERASEGLKLQAAFPLTTHACWAFGEWADNG